MILLHTLFSAFYSWFYEKQKVKGSYFCILLLSRLYYCVVFYMFSNSFFSRIISFSFISELIIMWILYVLLIEKKIRFRFGTSKGKL